MKDTLKQTFRGLHTWAGLIIGWLLFVIFLTGTLSVFRPEITQWMQPEIPADRISSEQALNVAIETLQQQAPRQSKEWSVQLPTARDATLSIQWGRDRQKDRAILHPLTGEKITPRATQGGRFFTNFHIRLSNQTFGSWIVFAASIAMLLAIITGIALHKRLFQDFFTFRPHSAPHRVWMDVHLLTGVLLLPFAVMITYTGASILFPRVISSPVKMRFEDPRGYREALFPSFERKADRQKAPMLPASELFEKAQMLLGDVTINSVTITHPNDRQNYWTFSGKAGRQIAAMSDRVTLDGITGELLSLQNEFPPEVKIPRTMVGLHVARFGGTFVPWLYFVLGLGVTVTIGTGLILFTMKRRKRPGQEFGAATPTIYRMIESINVAVIMGTAIAILAYLWANRLLPMGLEKRAEWETTVFFGIWVLTFIHALFRPIRSAWIEQGVLAAVLCLLLPFLGIFNPNVFLLRHLAIGDINRAIVDITAIVFGVCFSVLTWRLYRHFLSHKTEGGAI